MILSDIKHYLQQRGQATLADISTHFETSADAMRGMPETWVRKGRINRHLANASCGSSCSKCNPASTEIYEWVGPGRPAVAARSLPMPSHCDR